MVLSSTNRIVGVGLLHNIAFFNFYWWRQCSRTLWSKYCNDKMDTTDKGSQYLVFLARIPVKVHRSIQNMLRLFQVTIAFESIILPIKFLSKLIIKGGEMNGSFWQSWSCCWLISPFQWGVNVTFTFRCSKPGFTPTSFQRLKPPRSPLLLGRHEGRSSQGRLIDGFEHIIQLLEIHSLNNVTVDL
jgi:hypothetical protein